MVCNFLRSSKVAYHAIIAPMYTSYSLEDGIAQSNTYRRIQATILAVIGVAGVVAVGVVAPNVAGLLAKHGANVIRKANEKQNIAKAIKTLKKQGKIKVVDGHYELTDMGRIAFQGGVARAIHIHNKPKWDGKWRMVMFDVSEKHRERREQLRSMLQSFGFQQLQKSVWVYPYPCEELIALLQIELRVRKEAVYLVADAVQGEEKWLATFSLQKKQV